MDSEDRRRMGKTPDDFMFNHFLGLLLSKHIQLVGDDYRLGLTLDDNSGGSGIYNLLQNAKSANPEAKHRIRSICFSDDQIYVGLQAADLLVHSFYSEMVRRVSYPKLDRAPIYDRVACSFHSLFFDSSFLEDTARAWPTTHIRYVSQLASNREKLR